MLGEGSMTVCVRAFSCLSMPCSYAGRYACQLWWLIWLSLWEGDKSLAASIRVFSICGKIYPEGRHTVCELGPYTQQRGIGRSLTSLHLFLWFLSADNGTSGFTLLLPYPSHCDGLGGPSDWGLRATFPSLSCFLLVIFVIAVRQVTNTSPKLKGIWERLNSLTKSENHS